MKAMHNDRPKLSLFPNAPTGAMLFARYIAYHQLAGNSALKTTKKLLFDNPQGRGFDMFGATLQKVKEVLPDTESFDAPQLMKSSTLFGLYSAVLPNARKAAFQENLLAGRSLYLNTFLPAPHGRKFIKTGMHFCSECLSEDRAKFGIAFWRVVHQLHGVHHCPQHGLALKGICSTCGKSQASNSDWNPPSLLCPHCGDKLFEETPIDFSPAYQRYLALCNKAAQGMDVGLSPEKRITFYTRFTYCEPLTTDSPSHNSLLERVLAEWRVSSLCDLESTLGIPFNERFLRLAYAGNDAIVHPLGHIAILASLNEIELNEVQGNDLSSPSQPETTAYDQRILKSKDEKSDSLDRTIIDLALAHGLPPRVAILLQNSEAPYRIAAEYGISPLRMLPFRTLLKEKGLLIPVSQHRPTPCRPTQQKPKLDLTIQSEKCRKRIREAIAMGYTGREQVKKKEGNAIRWCCQHDRQWLDEILPCKRIYERLPPELKATTYKQRIVEYLSAHPSASRGELDARLRREFRWCYAKERPWLDSVLPARKRSQAKASDSTVLLKCPMTARQTDKLPIESPIARQ